MAQIAGVEHVTSVSSPGLAVMTVQFSGFKFGEWLDTTHMQRVLK